MDEKSALGSQLESFREARREMEASVLPLATSVDGRRFSFQASLHGLELEAGGYAVLDDGGTRRLGQVLSVELDQQLAGELTLPPSAGGGPVARTELQVRYARGEGIIVDGGSAPFHDALIHPAAGSDVQEWQQREARPRRAADAGRAGTLAPGVPCVADAGGFNRHTFLCGQSGSGKTYSLGVILERLLTRRTCAWSSSIRTPTSRAWAEVRADADPALAARYVDAARRVAVYSADAPGRATGCGIHAAEVDPATQAAALRLDPIADREEYAELAALLAGAGPDHDAGAGRSDRPEAVRLGLRIKNLRRGPLLGLGSAASRVRSSTRSMTSVRCVVVDLGSLPSPRGAVPVAAAVLGDLWRRRQERESGPHRDR